MKLHKYINCLIAFTALLVLVVMLSGCATTQANCPPIEKPIQVKVPVEVPCKAHIVPKPKLETVPPGTPGGLAGIDVKVRVLLDNLDLETAYATQLEAANVACQ